MFVLYLQMLSVYELSVMVPSCQNMFKNITKSLYEEKSLDMDMVSKLAFTCPKLTIETLEQGVKYVQS